MTDALPISPPLQRIPSPDPPNAVWHGNHISCRSARMPWPVSLARIWNLPGSGRRRGNTQTIRRVAHGTKTETRPALESGRGIQYGASRRPETRPEIYRRISETAHSICQNSGSCYPPARNRGAAASLGRTAPDRAAKADSPGQKRAAALRHRSRRHGRLAAVGIAEVRALQRDGTGLPRRWPLADQLIARMTPVGQLPEIQRLQQLIVVI